MRNAGIASPITALLLLALVTAPTRADGGNLKDASRLREEANGDWKKKRFDDAVAKLRRAADIYKRAGPDFRRDRAVVIRAMTYNLVHAGKLKEAQTALRELMRLRTESPALGGEMRSAYHALYQAAAKSGDQEARAAVLDPVRRTALDLDLPRVAAQVLHDLAFLAGNAGNDDLCIALNRKAAEERRQIRDWTGYAWSLNNLAHRLIATGKQREALEPLARGYETLHRRSLAEPQAAVAFNLRRLLKAPADAQPDAKPDPKLVAATWIGRLLKAGARSDLPRIIPLDALARRLLWRAPGDLSAQRIAKLAPQNTLAEVRADLAIRAADAAGTPKLKLELLQELVTGDGPCAPHLQARASLVRALAHAAKSDRGAHIDAANKALAGFKALGDVGGRRDAARRCLTASVALADGTDDALESARKGWEAILQDGTPGGAGGSSTASGRHRRPSATEPVFFITWQDKKIRIEDRIANKSWTFDGDWRPKNLSVNGVSLTLFGGYVSIRNFQYGRGASSSGAPGIITLDGLGEYRPLPKRGTLEVLGNGATRYSD